VTVEPGNQQLTDLMAECARHRLLILSVDNRRSAQASRYS
jgi:hypothetical protein